MSVSSPQLNYYRPSGAAPAAGVLVTLVAGVAAGVILGAVYAFVNHHDPLIYLNVLLAGGFGWVLGWIVRKGVRVFRIRNTLIATGIALIVFIAAYAAHWPVYVSTVISVEEDERYNVPLILELAGEFAKEPAVLWDVIQALNEEGIWTLGRTGSSRSGMPVKGILLALVWLGEALGIGWYAVTGPRKEAGKPYSERQDKWMEAKELPNRIAFIEDEEKFIAALAQGNFSALTAPLPDWEGETPMTQYAVVTLYPDAFEPCVSVKNIAVTDGKKKKEEITATEILRYLKISPTTAQSVSGALGSPA